MSDQGRFYCKACSIQYHFETQAGKGGLDIFRTQATLAAATCIRERLVDAVPKHFRLRCELQVPNLLVVRIQHREAGGGPFRGMNNNCLASKYAFIVPW